MLDETEPNQRILKAEIARELGEFDECLRLLSHPFDERVWVCGWLHQEAG